MSLFASFMRLMTTRRGLPASSELKSHLLGVEINAPSLEALVPQLCGKVAQHLQFLGPVAFPSFESLLGFLVREASVGVNDRAAKPPSHHLGLCGHLKHRAERESVLVRAQRTQVVGEDFGQHGDGPVDQIDTGGALHRFAVQRRTPGSGSASHLRCEPRPPSCRFRAFANSRRRQNLSRRRGQWSWSRPHGNRGDAPPPLGQVRADCQGHSGRKPWPPPPPLRGIAYGSPNSAKIACISTSCSPCWPRT